MRHFAKFPARQNEKTAMVVTPKPQGFYFSQRAAFPSEQAAHTTGCDFFRPCLERQDAGTGQGRDAAAIGEQIRNRRLPVAVTQKDLPDELPGEARKSADGK